MAKVLVCVLLAVSAVQAGELINVNEQGLALQGFAPVAFFTEKKPVKGMESLVSAYRGATYRFASEEHKAAFSKDLDRFVPAFGGFCAYAVAQGHTPSVEIDTWQILHDRLVLNYTRKVRKLFDSDPEGYLKKADSNLPGLVEAQGK